MSARVSFDYAVVRVVPRVERDEFLNVGVIVHCPTRRYLETRIELDVERLRALAPEVDPEEVQRFLDAFARTSAGADGAGPIAKLTPSARFHWLVGPSSTMIQTSPVHSGLCTNLDDELDHLMKTLVQRPATAAG